jgi:hypothetical protein
MQVLINYKVAELAFETSYLNRQSTALPLAEIHHHTLISVRAAIADGWMF